ncbi:MAG: hypothetical protein HKN47_28425, partial [Pirellulaceae bacterium]|nr:hypothetical protein [Pirellulaceae bacterium]
IFSRPAYSQPNYARPAYSQPTYPSYSQPNYGHTTYSQPTYSQPTYTRPATASFQGTSVATSSSFAPAPTPTTQRPATLRPAAPRPAVQQPAQRPANTAPVNSQVQSQGVPQTPAATAPVKNPVNNASAESNALQMLASIAAAPSTTPTAAQNTPPATTPAQPTIPEFTAASTQSVGAHVGTWRVSLPGNQSVQLTLDAAGSFVWTASKNGKSSKFNGQYRLNNGRLTLVRAADLQQMAGTWSGKDSAFTFKLDGAKNGGLNFQRS